MQRERERFTEAKFTREDYRNSSSFIKTFLHLCFLGSKEGLLQSQYKSALLGQTEPWPTTGERNEPGGNGIEG